MHRISRLLVLAAPLLLTACATTQGLPLAMTVPAEPKAADFKATGELRSSIGKSAAFDGWRIVGPLVNLTRNADGSWEGTGGPRMSAFRLDVEPGKVRGPNVNLSVQKMANGFVEIGGLFFEDRYWVQISQQQMQGNTHNGACSFQFKRAGPGLFTGDIACGMSITPASIEFLGVAAQAGDPVLPQVAIALMAVMP